MALAPDFVAIAAIDQFVVNAPFLARTHAFDVNPLAADRHNVAMRFATHEPIRPCRDFEQSILENVHWNFPQLMAVAMAQTACVLQGE
jgi:hypothetical protein